MFKKLLSFAISSLFIVSVLLLPVQVSANGSQLPGDIIDDEMGYEDINAVPWGYINNGAQGNVGSGQPETIVGTYGYDRMKKPAGYTGDWYDTPSAEKSGSVRVNENGELEVTYDGTPETGDTGLYKVLATDASYGTNDKYTLEFAYTKDDNLKLYMNIESNNNWRAALGSMQHGTNNAFSIGSNIFTGKVKVTVQFDLANKTADVYVNDEKQGTLSDAKYGASYYNLGKLRIVAQNGSAKGSKFTLHYVRFMKTAEYTNVLMAKDKAIIDAALPVSNELDTDSPLTLLGTDDLIYGNEAQWSSSDDSVIDPVTGAVTRDQTESRNVTLTLTLYNKLTDSYQQFNYNYEVAPITPQNEQFLVNGAPASELVTLDNTGGIAAVTADGLTLSKTGSGRVAATVNYDIGAGFKANEKMTTKFDAAGTGSITIGGTEGTVVYNETRLADGNVSQTSGAVAWNGTGGSFQYKITPKFGTVTAVVDGGETINAVLDANDSSALGTIRFEIPENAPAGTTLTISNLKISTDAARMRTMFANGISVEKIAGGDGIGQTESLTLPRAFYGNAVQWASTSRNVSASTGAVTPLSDYGMEDVTLSAACTVGDQSLAGEIKIVLIGEPAGNLAKGKNVSTNARLETGSQKEYLTDGGPYYRFVTKGSESSLYATIDLGEEKLFGRVVADELTNAISAYKVEISTDNKTWTEAAAGTTVGAKRAIDFTPVTARYIKFSITEKMAQTPVELAELMVFENLDDKKIVDLDRDELVMPATATVTENLTLPLVGNHGSAITWTTTDASQITNDGVVTRPTYDSDPVTLTATFSYQTAKTTKNWTYTVPSLKGKKPSSNGGGSSGGSGGGSGSAWGSNDKYVPIASPTPTPPAEEEPLFSDLGEAAWATESITALANRGILNGSDGKVRPNDEITRAEYVKMLVVAVGLDPQPDAEVPFDIDKTDWFYPYVAAAYEAGLVTGVSPDQFGAELTISRQDMAVMTDRALKKLGKKLTKTKEYTGFADEQAIADYAADSIRALYEGGVISGTDEGSFNPAGQTTRAEAATVLYKIID